MGNTSKTSCPFKKLTQSAFLSVGESQVQKLQLSASRRLSTDFLLFRSFFQFFIVFDLLYSSFQKKFTFRICFTYVVRNDTSAFAWAVHFDRSDWLQISCSACTSEVYYWLQTTSWLQRGRPRQTIQQPRYYKLS